LKTGVWTDAFGLILSPLPGFFGEGELQEEKSVAMAKISRIGIYFMKLKIEEVT